MSRRVLVQVLTYRPAVLVGTLTAFIVLTIAAVLPNLPLILAIVFDGGVDGGTKASFFFQLYGSLHTNQTLLSLGIVVVTAFLCSLLAMLLTYYISISKTASVPKQVISTSIAGVVAGFLGIGCAACGSIILTALFVGVGGTTLSLLPFQGVEIGLLGIGLLVYAVVLLAKKIQMGVTCPIVNDHDRSES